MENWITPQHMQDDIILSTYSLTTVIPVSRIKISFQISATQKRFSEPNGENDINRVIKFKDTTLKESAEGIS